MKPQVDIVTRPRVEMALEEILTEVSVFYKEAILVPRVTRIEYQDFLSKVMRLDVTDKKVLGKLANILSQPDQDEQELEDAQYRRALQRAIKHFADKKEITTSLLKIQQEWSRRDDMITSAKFATLEQKMPPDVIRILNLPDKMELRRLREGKLWRITDAIAFMQKQEVSTKQTVIEFLEASKQEFMNKPDRIRIYPASVLSKTKTLWINKAKQIKNLVKSPLCSRDTVLQIIPMLLPDSDATPDTIVCGVNDVLTMLKQNNNEQINRVSRILMELARAKETDTKQAWDNLWPQLTVPLRKKLKDNGIVWDTEKDTLIRHMNSVDVLGLFRTVDPDDLAARWSTMDESTLKEICGTIDVNGLIALSHKGYLKVVCQAWPWIQESVKVQYLDNISHPKGKSVVPIQLLPIHRKYLIHWIELEAESKEKRSSLVDEASRIFNQRLQRTNEQVQEFDLFEFYNWFTDKAMQMYRHGKAAGFAEQKTEDLVLQIIRHKDIGELFPVEFLQHVPTKYRMYMREYHEGEDKSLSSGYTAMTSVQTELRERLRILDLWLSAWDTDRTEQSAKKLLNRWLKGTKAEQDLPPIAAAASLIDAWLDALETVYKELGEKGDANAVVNIMVTFGTFDDIPDDILQKLKPEYRVTFDPDNPLFGSDSPLQTQIREAYTNYEQIVKARPQQEEEDVPMNEDVEDIFTRELTLNVADASAVLHLLQKDETEQLEMKKPAKERNEKLLKRTVVEAEWLSYLLLRDPLVRQRWNIQMLDDQLKTLAALPQSPRNNVLISLVHELRESLNTPWSALRRGEWNKYCSFSPEEKKSDNRTIKFPVVTSKDNVTEIEQWTNLCNQYCKSRTTSKPELSIALHPVDETSVISLMEIVTAPLDYPVAWARDFSLFVSDLIEENKAFKNKLKSWFPWKPDHFRAKWKQSLKKHAREKTDEAAEKLARARNNDQISSEDYDLLSDQSRFYRVMTNRQEFLRMLRPDAEDVVWSTRRRLETMVIDEEDAQEWKQRPEWIHWNNLFKQYYGFDWTKPPTAGKANLAVYEQWKNSAPRILMEIEMAACLDYIDSECVKIYQFRHQVQRLRSTDIWILDREFEPALDRIQQYLDVSNLEREVLPAHLQPWLEEYPDLSPDQLFDEIVDNEESDDEDAAELYWQCFNTDMDAFRRRIGLCINRILASENGCKAKAQTVQKWAFRVYRGGDLPTFLQDSKSDDQEITMEQFLSMILVPSNDSEIQQWCMSMAEYINKSKEYRTETLCEWHNLPVPKKCRDVIRETKLPRVFGVPVGLNYLLEAMSNFDTQRAREQIDMISNKDLEEFAKGSYYPRYKNHFLRCGIFDYLYNAESLTRVTEEKKAVKIVYKLSLEEANDVFQHYDELPFEALWYARKYCKERKNIIYPQQSPSSAGRHYLMRMGEDYDTLEELNRILRAVWGSRTFGIRRPSAAIRDIVKPFAYVEGVEDEEASEITEKLKRVGSLSSWISKPFYGLDGRMYVQVVTTTVPASYQDE